MRHETNKAFKNATAAVPGIQSEHDVSQIATRGHVNAARLHQVGRWGFLPAVLFAGLGLWALSETRPAMVSYNASPAAFMSGNGGAPVMPGQTVAPAWIKSMLTFDPATYFDLGGGLRGNAEMRWLADYKPKPESLSVAQFDALVNAVATDQKASPDPTQWATVAGLEVRPQITRLERTFSEHAARLPTGIIGLPEGRGNVALIIAHVAGQWAMADVRNGQCRSILGPLPTGCAPVDPNAIPEDYARRILLNLKPVEAPTEPKE